MESSIRRSNEETSITGKTFAKGHGRSVYVIELLTGTRQNIDDVGRLTCLRRYKRQDHVEETVDHCLRQDNSEWHDTRSQIDVHVDDRRERHGRNHRSDEDAMDDKNSSSFPGRR
jgi:hypothetical protein